MRLFKRCCWRTTLKLDGVHVGGSTPECSQYLVGFTPGGLQGPAKPVADKNLLANANSYALKHQAMQTAAPPNIIVAKAENAAEIAALVNAAYRGDSGKQGWTTEAAILDGLRTDAQRVARDITRPNSVILVKIEENKITACVHLEKKDAETAYLGMLTTDVSRQSQGTGKQLMLASEEFVKKIWKCKTIEMTVIDSRHELISYYVRRGYRVTDEKRPFPTDPAFGIPKAGPLEFVVLTKEIP